MVYGKGIIIHIYSSNEQIVIIRGNDFLDIQERGAMRKQLNLGVKLWLPPMYIYHIGEEWRRNTLFTIYIRTYGRIVSYEIPCFCHIFRQWKAFRTIDSNRHRFIFEEYYIHFWYYIQKNYDSGVLNGQLLLLIRHCFWFILFVLCPTEIALLAIRPTF